MTIPPTDWKLIQESSVDSPLGRQKLGELLEIYRRPILNFYRRRMSADDAADTYQAFVLEVIEKRIIGDADPTRGRFRNYLTRAADNFAKGRWRHQGTQKQGGGIEHVDLDHPAAADLPQARTWGDPEVELKRDWAQALVDHVDTQLRAHYVAQDREALFELLRPHLIDDVKRNDYKPIAEQLGLGLQRVRELAYEMRQRWRQMALREAARQCGTVEEGKAELDELLGMLNRG